MKKNGDQNKNELLETTFEKNLKLQEICKKISPSIKSSPAKLIVAHIILVLQIEGIIKKDLDEKDIQMVDAIRMKMTKDNGLLEETINNIKEMIK